MNKTIFNKLMKEGVKKLLQTPEEWKMFLEVCEVYLKRHSIKKPVVVELGVWEDKTRGFFEQLFGAEYISIDKSDERSKPDILGDTHDPETLNALKDRLDGRPINILFIDASHYYEDVKKDFALYSPLCKDIIALHDTECMRYKRRKTAEVWKFWDELKEKSYEVGAGEIEGYLFLSIFKKRHRGCQRGIGVIIKKGE